MKDSGAALWVANAFLDLLSPLGIEGGVPLWTAVSALTTGVTNLMSNGAAVAVIGPITLKMAAAAGESPLLIGFITAISSAFAYLTVIGTPACTIVYASGYLKTTDFLRVGYRMVIVSTVLLIISAYLFWPPDRVVGWRAKYRERLRKPGSRHCAIQESPKDVPEAAGPPRFSILVCIDGTDASYRALRHAVRIGSGTDADLTLLYVRPIDRDLQTGGMQISVVRENLLDWGLELPGAVALRRGRELLVELGWLGRDWQAEFAHVDVQGDPLGDNAIIYSSPKGRSVVLRLLIAPSVPSGILDEAKLGEFDLLIVGMPEGEKALRTGFRFAQDCKTGCPGAYRRRSRHAGAGGQRRPSRLHRQLRGLHRCGAKACGYCRPLRLPALPAVGRAGGGYSSGFEEDRRDRQRADRKGGDSGLRHDGAGRRSRQPDRGAGPGAFRHRRYRGSRNGPAGARSSPTASRSRCSNAPKTRS